MYLLIVTVFILPNIQQIAMSKSQYSFNAVLKLWHIETFEGGAISRASFLNSRAKEFEKNNKGTYISITTLTVEQLIDRLASGEQFDLISYSVGVGALIVDKLLEYKLYDGLLRLKRGGYYNEKQLAVPYMHGGYGLISLSGMTDKVTNFKSPLESVFDSHYINSKNNSFVYSLNVGFSDYIQPLIALRFNTAKNCTNTANISIETNKTQYEAYTELLSTRFSTFTLGSQRDVVRLDNKVNNGLMEKYSFTPLADFTDLVQYISVGRTVNSNISAKFIEYLLSDKSQSQLSKVGMLSPTMNLYSSSNMYLLEQALSNPSTINVFTSLDRLQQLRQLSIDSIFNGGDFSTYLC